MGDGRAPFTGNLSNTSINHEEEKINLSFKEICNGILPVQD